MTAVRFTRRACATFAGLIIAACIIYDTWEQAVLDRRRAVKDAHWDELAGQARANAARRAA